METKNLGLVKAIFIQAASPVRTDVWWYDTTNNLLKYWDVGLLTWKEVTGGGGGFNLTYTKTSVLPNTNTDILLGLTSAIRGLIIEYVGERGDLNVEGVGRALISVVAPYEVATDEQGDEIGATFQIMESGVNLVLRVTVDDLTTDPYNFSYRIETKPKF